MLWLLDTNVISDLRKPAPNKGVVEWMLQNQADCALSEVTFAELYYGLYRLPFNKRRSQLARWIEFLREDYRDVILPIGPSESQAWGEYAAEIYAARGKKFWNERTIRDSALAATARAYSLVMVTRDTSHFPFIEALNPFTN